jgi:hypothetical protein
LLLTEAFSKYNAKLKNPRFSVAAENSKGELVISLWKHHFSPPDGNLIVYSDHLSRWSGTGNSELRDKITHAFENKQVVRAVIARTNKISVVESGGDLSKIDNVFFVKDNWFGEVTSWDDDNFEITFLGK